MKERGKKFRLSERLESFRHAFRGILALISYEHNFRIHLVILTAVILAGLCFGISVTDWLAIISVSALVLVSESFNSSVEYLSDALRPEPDERIRNAKDIAAAAVLIAAISSIITGLIIFVPEFKKLFD